MPDDVFLHLDDVIAVRASLSEETDRGCAMMAAAYLDDQLKLLLRQIMVEDEAVIDELLRASGPLAAFSARINLCFALGLLPPMARRDLHLIRKIRNDFGHTAKPQTFEDAAISARCKELYYATANKPTARGKFTNAALGVCAIIHAEIWHAVHKEVCKDVVITDNFRAKTEEFTDALIAASEGGSIDYEAWPKEEQKILRRFEERLKQLAAASQIKKSR
jgi:DNA-binding MltR family transcriptional regulator